MPVDLTQYGFPCTLTGEVRVGRTEGERFLFLFSETHDDYPMIRQNLLNACALIDGGYVRCVGVEGEYSFEGWTQAEIVAESQSLFAAHGNDAALIDFFIADAQEMDAAQPGVPHLFFGTCLKLLRPSVPVRQVEVADLADAAQDAQDVVIAKHAIQAGVAPAQFEQWIREKSHTEQVNNALLEFRNHPIHLQRDLSFVHGLIPFWDANGGGGAAILNAGAARQDRIADNMPAEFKFVQIYQPPDAAQP